MPLPEPNQGEDKDKFMERCMGSEAMNSEFPDEKQRAAVCMRQFHGGKTIAMRHAKVFHQAKISTETDGEISGYAAYWDKIDLDGDIIRKGTFKRSIGGPVKAGKVLLQVVHFAHGGDVRESIGVLTEAKEDDVGFWIRAKLFGTTLAQETREKISAAPEAFGMSIGWRDVQGGFKKIDTGKEYTDMALEEVTITVKPAQPWTKGSVQAKSDNELIESIVQRLEALESKAQEKDTAKEHTDTAPAPVQTSEAPALSKRNQRVLSILEGYANGHG